MKRNRRQVDPDLADLLVNVQARSRDPIAPREMIELLQERGYKIVKEDPTKVADRFKSKTSTRRWEGGKVFRVAVVSDTHFGSRCQQPTFLNAFYDLVQARGIETVYHTGDLFDGDGRVYRGQEFDLFLHGYDAQLEYATQVYPRREGVTTYLISGNHDWSFHTREGADICRALSERRPDIKYLGAFSAVDVVDGIKIQLLHAKGGRAYARSYRLQKIIEQFAPLQKPHILLMGNFHSWNFMPMYRNVVAWQVGCFQSQTNYEKELGLNPEIGGLILEVRYATPDSDLPPGFVSVVPEVIPLYVPKAGDY